MATITLSPELSERVEKAAKARGTDAPALAESLLNQILSVTEAEVAAALEAEDLRRTITRAHEEMKAGGGRAFEDFVRDWDARIAVERQGRPIDVSNEDASATSGASARE